MDNDHILRTMASHGVDALVIGGMNFLLRHEPVLTYDIDLWICDEPGNLDQCEAALADLDPSWGQAEAEWRRIPRTLRRRHDSLPDGAARGSVPGRHVIDGWRSSGRWAGPPRTRFSAIRQGHASNKNACCVPTRVDEAATLHG